MQKYVVRFLFGMVFLSMLSSCDKEELCTKGVQYDEDTGQYVILDESTGETWMRCRLGEEWDEEGCTCEGEPTQVLIADAPDACPDGFILPSNEDFASILCNSLGGHTRMCPNEQYEKCKNCEDCRNLFGSEDEGIFLTSDHGDREDDCIVGSLQSLKYGCQTSDLFCGLVEVRCKKNTNADAENVCVYGQDHTCNDSPTISSLHGTCNEDGTCTCIETFEKNPETGLCQ
jgi:hypothetical protein